MKTLSLVICCLLTAFCLMAADYEVKTVKILPIESYPARIKAGSVTVAADPYATDQKSYSAFDVKKLNSRGYFPIHVIIQNTSDSFLIVRTRNIVLVTESGQQLYTTPTSVLVDDLFKGNSADRLSSKSTDSPSRANLGTPLSDFTNKDLTNKLIEPGKVSDGFLFFFTPDPKKNLFAGSTLFIPKIEEEGTRKSIGPFSIPLDPALLK
jgi:hypothetical protein